MTLLVRSSPGLRRSSSPRLSLLPFLSSTLPGPSASDVTILWRYTNALIIIIILTPVLNSQGMKKIRYAIQKVGTKINLE